MVRNGPNKSKSRSASNNPGKRKVSQNSAVKNTNIEVLDHETPIEMYQENYNISHNIGHGGSLVTRGGGSSNSEIRESDDLFNKLIINLNNNDALKNESIKRKFKLDLIKDEEDLHKYKNLLNAMAALFYTNHRMIDVQDMFKEWLKLSRARQNKL